MYLSVYVCRMYINVSVLGINMHKMKTKSSPDQLSKAITKLDSLRQYSHIVSKMCKCLKWY